MIVSTDILLNDNGQLQIEDGDFVVGESDNQHIKAILLSHVGNIKLSPLLGVDAQRFINSSGQETTLLNRIVQKLKEDNYSLERYDFVKSLDSLIINIKAKKQK